MAEFPALPLWTDAYLADTRHLSTEEHGAYLLLMIEAWRRPECSLPDDDVLLARLAGVSMDRWNGIRAVVMAFWDRDGRRKTWTQKRLFKERLYVAKKSASQRDKAARRWKETKKADAAALPNVCPADAPTPTPTPIEERTEAKASGDFAADPVKAVFDAGVSILGSCGMRPDAARRFVGKLRKDYPGQDGLILSAIMDCGKAGAVDPVPWITARLVPKKPLFDLSNFGADK